MNRFFVLYVFFAISGLVMAWLSLGLSCAHFDIEGMCRDLSNSVQGSQKVSFTNCFRLAELSKDLCGRIWTVSWLGTLFGIAGACFGTKQAIEIYANQSWENENI